jgi:hypothetical protein
VQFTFVWFLCLALILFTPLLRHCRNTLFHPQLQGTPSLRLTLIVDYPTTGWKDFFAQVTGAELRSVVRWRSLTPTYWPGFHTAQAAAQGRLAATTSIAVERDSA